jgi:hypothetical protein
MTSPYAYGSTNHKIMLPNHGEKGGRSEENGSF